MLDVILTMYITYVKLTHSSYKWPVRSSELTEYRYLISDFRQLAIVLLLEQQKSLKSKVKLLRATKLGKVSDGELSRTFKGLTQRQKAKHLWYFDLLHYTAVGIGTICGCIKIKGKRIWA